MRAVPGELMVVGSSPTRGSQFFLKNDCFGRVVLCCFAFLLFVALPFSASIGVIVHELDIQTMGLSKQYNMQLTQDKNELPQAGLEHVNIIGCLPLNEPYMYGWGSFYSF